MKITQSFTPLDQADWRKWLEQHHDREQEVWLVYFKPASGKTGIGYETSVEEALCFGWIDSIIQKIDDETYARKFNPRRMDSRWSETNQRRIAKLVREGRMTEVGLAKVTFDVNEVDLGKPKAKRPPFVIPENVERALKATPKLWDEFQKVPSSFRRNYVGWLASAKKPETFEKRLAQLTEEVLSGHPVGMH